MPLIINEAHERKIETLAIDEDAGTRRRCRRGHTEIILCGASATCLRTPHQN